MLRAVRLFAVPFLLLAALRPLSAQTVDQLLSQPPEKLAALKTDPHVAKAMKFLDVSDSRADVLKKADGVLDAVMMSEQREHPGQNALFWNAFRDRVRGQIQEETNAFLLLSAQLYAQRFTDAELDQLISFYSSGIGAKYFRERAALDRQELDLASAWSEQVTPRVLEKVRASMNAGKGKSP
ncbi:MAG TPA: DUF2059 domain-containing protein [Rhizomicrobium sp.]|jgi:hypothetical protein|nr:DUF2059 domain-containing protein [Rhizomicrobium sp.]